MIPQLKTLGRLDKNVDLEFSRDYLNPLYIDPLKKLGYEFKGYKTICDDLQSPGMSCHILFFMEVEHGLHIAPDEKYEKMVEICTQDDDNQPHATYRLYMGSLFIMIPYFI